MFLHVMSGPFVYRPRPELPESDQFALFFIPQAKSRRGQAGAQSQRLDLAEQRACLVTRLQEIVRRAWLR